MPDDIAQQKALENAQRLYELTRPRVEKMRKKIDELLVTWPPRDRFSRPESLEKFDQAVENAVRWIEEEARILHNETRNHS